MNKLTHFADVEKTPEREDRFEGATHVQHHRGVRVGFKVRTEDRYTSLGEVVRPIRFRSNRSEDHNAFCMFALREGNAHLLLDNRIQQFGDSFALIANVDEFLKRVRNAAQADHFEIKYGLVDYVDEEYSGYMGPFRKYRTYSHQSEFRVVMTTGKRQPHRMHLGCLSDIVAMTGPSSAVNRHIKVDKVVDSVTGSSVVRAFYCVAPPPA